MEFKIEIAYVRPKFYSLEEYIEKANKDIEDKCPGAPYGRLTDYSFEPIYSEHTKCHSIGFELLENLNLHPEDVENSHIEHKNIHTITLSYEEAKAIDMFKECCGVTFYLDSKFLDDKEYYGTYYNKENRMVEHGIIDKEKMLKLLKENNYKHKILKKETQELLDALECEYKKYKEIQNERMLHDIETMEKAEIKTKSIFKWR